jgi:hypothetical protein
MASLPHPSWARRFLALKMLLAIIACGLVARATSLQTEDGALQLKTQGETLWSAITRSGQNVSADFVHARASEYS